MQNHQAIVEKMPLLSRRQFVGGLAAMVGVAALPKPVMAALSLPARTLAFENLHTGETLKTTYFEQGRYIPGALRDINHVLRDHRTGDIANMDPKLLDLLFTLHHKLDSSAAFQVISGYRSPASNAMLHNHSSGVAKKSMHMEGRAIDIRLQDAQLSHVRDAALAMAVGGVGYYPESQFVHVDTGRVRHW